MLSNFQNCCFVLIAILFIRTNTIHHIVTRKCQIALLRRWPSRVGFHYHLPTTISRDYMSERGEVFVCINSSQIFQSKYPSFIATEVSRAARIKQAQRLRREEPWWGICKLGVKNHQRTATHTRNVLSIVETYVMKSMVGLGQSRRLTAQRNHYCISTQSEGKICPLTL